MSWVRGAEPFSSNRWQRRKKNNWFELNLCDTQKKRGSNGFLRIQNVWPVWEGKKCFFFFFDKITFKLYALVDRSPLFGNIYTSRHWQVVESKSLRVIGGSMTRVCFRFVWETSADERELTSCRVVVLCCSWHRRPFGGPHIGGSGGYYYVIVECVNVSCDESSATGFTALKGRMYRAAFDLESKFFL